jgi:hypothetical protein
MKLLLFAGERARSKSFDIQTFSAKIGPNYEVLELAPATFDRTVAHQYINPAGSER